jgi:hypothetical protein
MSFVVKFRWLRFGGVDDFVPVWVSLFPDERDRLKELPAADVEFGTTEGERDFPIDVLLLLKYVFCTAPLVCRLFDGG